ncbi:MAG: nucleotidyltransferase domain-containing protein [Candidatus Moraniibacteriota bacterium]
MSTNQKLVEFLREQYRPHVIVLAGSRSNGTYTADSDWDVFLFCDTKGVGGVSKWNDQELDITFHEWPKPKEWIFTNPYGPVWPVKVLFDDTDGVFDAILKQTEEVYGKGSKVAYSTGCVERLNKLDRWVGKLEKYKNDFEVRFYYAGIAYEAFVRVWFEQRNLWPLPPAQALPFIRRNDVEFWDLLSGFTRANGRESVDMARAIAKQLQAI